ncbi:hypothetical protein HAZT_HAZT003560 [Hyalella azteca]|uniref:Uncharacterized protein n=1 Tax=Hyalella azteca TaxID=294128 RepID=A0A6A0GUS2_HYAAZ|nr:hypothetical protein HAZT_HAZT003560 [Hyalella azteca]
MSGQSPSPGAAHSPMGPPQQAPSPMPPPPQATSPAGVPSQSPMGPPQVPSSMGPPGMAPNPSGLPPNGPGGPPGPPGSAGPHGGGYVGGAGGWPSQQPYPGGQPPSGPSSGPGGIYPAQESLNALQKAINTMEDKGMQGDPRYSDLLSMRAKYGAAGSGYPPSGDGRGAPMASGPVTGVQMHQLRAQIMAYRFLARSQPVPSQVALVAQGRRPESNDVPPRAPGIPSPAPGSGSPMGLPTSTPPAPAGGSMPPGGHPRLPLSGMSQQTPPPIQTQPSQPGAMRPPFNGSMPPQPPPTASPVPQTPPTTSPTSGSPVVGPPTPATTSAPPASGAPAPPSATSTVAVPTPSPAAQRPPGVGPGGPPSSKTSRVTPIAKPAGIDPLLLLQERENRLGARIAQRMEDLSNLPNSLPEELQLKAELELRALRLLNFQRQLRAEVVACNRADTTLETAINMKAYKRTKRQGLREARITEKLEKQQKLEAERKKRQKHQEYLNAVLQHGRELKEFHRQNTQKIGKINKAVVTYHQNAEREKQKEQERIEKERLRRLMLEDEEGYRKLIDEKKDKRLAYLLSQTDEFIASLTEMVKQHKDEQKRQNREFLRKVREERRRAREAAESAGGEGGQVPFVCIMESSTGRILMGAEAPAPQHLEQFLLENPGWEVLPDDEDDQSDEEKETEEGTEKEGEEGAAAASAVKKLKPKVEDDEYRNAGGEANYYSIAHTIKEEIKEQPTMLVNGSLKEYQIKASLIGLEWLVSLYNNNLNGILADEMGLGKTIQTIALLTYLIETKKNNGPYLIIVPLSTMSNWALEFNKWAPSVNVSKFHFDLGQENT